MAAAIAGSNEILQTRWVLGSVPEKPAGGGYPMPKLSDFKAIREPIPAAANIQDGHVLIKHDFLSADPYVVAYRMTKPEHVDKTIWAGAAGTVVASKSKKFGVGDIVVGGGMCGSSEYSVRPEDTLDKIIYDTTKVPLSLSLGLLGMPGCTAFIGVTDLLGDDLTGKTVVVTGAAGAVGSAAGQIAKRLGAAKVIGLCGSAAKVERCLNKYKYDNCLNYKSATLDAELKALAPFHCFYDNTGGPAASSIKALMVDGGRVAKVGSIGGPSSDAHDGRLQIKGFYAGGVKDQWPAAIKTMAGWVHEGKLHYDETVLVGIESIPAAFIAQRTGKNTGKMIVDLASSDAEPASSSSSASAAQPRKLKLVYFNIEGKAEPIRMLCAYAGLALEDYRFANRAEFVKMRDAGELAFGQVPMLQVTAAGGGGGGGGGGGPVTNLIQSGAILRFIGKIADPALHLYPSDPEAAALVDAVIDQEADTFAGWRVSCYKERFGFSSDILTPDVSTSIQSTIASTVLPRHLKSLTRILGAGQWLARTDQPSVADFCWATALKNLPTTMGDPDYMKPFPELQAFVHRFYDLPAIKTYYQSKE